METQQSFFCAGKYMLFNLCSSIKLCCRTSCVESYSHGVIWGDKQASLLQQIVVCSEVFRPLFAQEHPFINNALCSNVSVGFWYCDDKRVLQLKGCWVLINILLQTGRVLEASLVNEWFWSAGDPLCASLVSCLRGKWKGWPTHSGFRCKQYKTQFKLVMQARSSQMCLHTSLHGRITQYSMSEWVSLTVGRELEQNKRRCVSAKESYLFESLLTVCASVAKKNR